MLGSYPVGVVLSLYVFVLRARWQLGYWPAPYRPDPKSLGFDIQHAQVWLGLASFPFVTVICLAWIIGAWARWKDFPVWRLLGFALLCSGMAFTWLRWDPQNFCAWFWD